MSAVQKYKLENVLIVILQIFGKCVLKMCKARLRRGREGEVILEVEVDGGEGSFCGKLGTTFRIHTALQRDCTRKKKLE